MQAPAVKSINLALQGGGSHGAFTWGVLDRLLEEERLLIEGISGTSAGAMNAAILAQGYHQGGRAGARKALDEFWRRIATLSVFTPARRTVLDRILGNWNVDRSPITLALDFYQDLFSPYESNPLGINPLRQVLEEMVIEKDIQSCRHVKIFVAATNVETGRVRVFERHEVTVDAVLASACLPFLFQAIEIEGTPYWDGGYMGNPVIWPLIYNCESPDVVLVQINPLIRPGTPRTRIEIMNRVSEISFNSSLMAEMRAVAFVHHLMEGGHLKTEEAKRLRRMHIHMIGAESQMRELGAASKTNAELDFLLYLRDLGRETAEGWLTDNWDMIGRRTSIDIRNLFL